MWPPSPYEVNGASVAFSRSNSNILRGADGRPHTKRPGPSSRCDHISLLPRLETQRDSDSPHSRGRHLTPRSFCLPSSVHALPVDVTTHRDLHPWNCIDLATFLTLSESLIEGGFEPMAIGSMGKPLIAELSYPGT